jgi:glutaminyl-peptide cyclotransferase
VNDDHVVLNEAGIRTIDIIDFDYPYWHTPQDTPDKVAAETLGAVGDVLLALIRRLGGQT